MKKKRGWAFWGVALGAFFLVLFAAWWGLKAKFDANKPPESYDFVARFERDGIPTITGSLPPGLAGSGEASVNLGEVKSPVVIVNFWASWCAPCVQEFPSMLKLVEALDGKVEVIAVSQDEDQNDLKTFLKLFKVPRKGFHVVWDPERKISAMYGVGKLPESYIAGKDRKLIRKVLGIEDWSTPNAIGYFESVAK